MRKNKKLMILVACLITVIGVSFAYFAATTIFSGNGASVSGTTAVIGGSELRVEGSLAFNDLNIYPGHQNVSSIKVTAIGENELIPYNVIWEGTNTLNTPLNFTVYKTSSEVDVSASCKQTKGVVDGALRYYEECSISNIDQLGSIVASGTINTNQTKATLVEDEFITSTNDGISVYYYVVLEYPNLDENQNSDIGGTFSGEVTVEESGATPDINIIAAYIEQEDGSYEEISDIPQGGYTLNTEKSACSNGATPTGNTPNITINNLSKSGTSCYLYFDEYNPYAARDILLSNYSTLLTRTDFSNVITNAVSETIYYADTTNGRTYYFAGNPTDNWVKFAGFWWRIIRINEDGTIRIIYQGTSANTIGTGTQTTTSTFNSSSSNNMYVGYMYKNGQVYGLQDSSIIKEALDSWYNTNLLNMTDKIDGNAGFCGDRMPSTSSGNINGNGGIGTTTTYYGGYIRMITNKTPSFECANNEDLYTANDSNLGNKALIYPIGLISADEITFAGGVYGINNNGYYLYTNSNYWTMSPSIFGPSGSAGNFYVNSDGQLADNWVYFTYDVRPVINLKADVQLTGSGTSTDPYVVVGAE